MYFVISCYMYTVKKVFVLLFYVTNRSVYISISRPYSLVTDTNTTEYVGHPINSATSLISRKLLDMKF